MTLARVRSLAVISLLLLAGGCAPPYPYRAFSPRVSPALGEMRDAHAAVKLFYATDRRMTDADSPELRFGIERGPRMQYGRVAVSIPSGHGRGRLEERPTLARRDPSRYVLTTRLDPPLDSPQEFWSALNEAVGRSARHEVFIFVHGFYVTFDEAARRTAQIAHDIEFDGPAIVYSWPSQGWLLGYLADSTNVEWAEPHLSELLGQIADQPSVQRVQVLAHSMGARLLSRSVRELERDRRPLHKPLFDQVVLAAADIDAEIFERDFADPLARAARRVTIYVSRNDWALDGSAKLHGYARLGQRGPMAAATDEGQPASEPVFPAGLDVVDMTAVDHGAVGHFYYGSSPDALDDIRDIIRGKTPLDRGLKPTEGHFVLVTK